MAAKDFFYCIFHQFSGKFQTVFKEFLSHSNKLNIGIYCIYSMQYYTTIDQTHHGGYPISIIIDSAILRNVEGL